MISMRKADRSVETTWHHGWKKCLLFDPRLVTNHLHYNDIIMGAIASQITSLTIVYSTVYSDADKKTSKLRVTGLCAGNSPGPMNSPHKWPVTRKMFSFDDVIMFELSFHHGDPRDTRSCKYSIWCGFRWAAQCFRFSEFVVCDSQASEGISQGLEWFRDRIAQQQCGHEMLQVINSGKETLTGNYWKTFIQMVKSVLWPLPTQNQDTSTNITIYHYSETCL